jgi:D-glycero-alpha-D-manno-heptose 1-phosphate guanylyltransferase
MMREAIVLAGGLGTRLKSVVPDLPKCLAPVAGKPFLDYLLLHFREKGIRRFLFALGYKAEPVEAFVKSRLSSTEYVFSVEQEPLGTGGAIRKACRQAAGTEVLVLNADSFFGVDPDRLSAFHEEKKADCTLALKPMRQFDRYGVVELNERQQVCGFSEKNIRKPDSSTAVYTCCRQTVF